MSDDVEILAFSEQVDAVETGGGDKEVPEVIEKTLDEQLKELGIDLSVDEIKELRDKERKSAIELAERKEKDREASVEKWVKDMEEAMAWAKRSPVMPGMKTEMEIRPFYEAEDLAEFVTPEELSAPRDGERGKLGVA